MNNKKMLWLGIILIIVIIAVIWIVNRNNKKVNDIIEEYTPIQEAEEDELRFTSLDLYFKDAGSNELKKEVRLVDSKILIDAPHYTIMNFLLDGPNDEELIKVIRRRYKIK